MSVTDEQLAEWERLVAAADNGPWKFLAGCGLYFVRRQVDTVTIGILRDADEAPRMLDAGAVCFIDGSVPASLREGTARFIAVAREAVPALVAEVRRLQQLLVQERDDERAAIAAWLRPHFPNIADALERGEHER